MGGVCVARCFSVPEALPVNGACKIPAVLGAVPVRALASQARHVERGSIAPAVAWYRNLSLEDRELVIFLFDVVTECPDVPAELLMPRNTWSDPSAYDATAGRLAKLFSDNFKTYESGVSADIKAAGPA